MNKKQYSSILENYDYKNQEHLIEIERLIYKYPYCQNIYAIYLKFLKDQNKYNYDEILKKTAIITFDRRQLYSWLNENRKTDSKKIEVKYSNPGKNFSENEIKKSFNEWITWTREKSKFDLKNSNNSKIINDFLEKNPKMPKVIDSKNINKKIENYIFNEDEFMTETLAKLYLKQEKYDNALIAYKILSLNYPEKNSLFANQIKLIKKLQKQSKN
mgnify:FL=1|tara:strand:+ start:910 stop:1554 length:645 start_codon:yes stop_codon:yes gene_type:complete